MEERAGAVYEFNKIFPPLFSKISGTDFNLIVNYQPSWKEGGSVEEIESILISTLERDKKMNTTTSGIHRDRFVVMSQYGPFSQIGSTGQLRLCSLIFRIAEALYFSTLTGKKPVLLLDDVFSELDRKRRDFLLSGIVGGQIFITCCDRTGFRSIKNGVAARIKAGTISGYRELGKPEQ